MSGEGPTDDDIRELAERLSSERVQTPGHADPRSAPHKRVEHDLTLHPPLTDDAARCMDTLRAESKKLAHLIVDLTPASREQSLALTKIEEALFFGVAAIARNQ